MNPSEQETETPIIIDDSEVQVSVEDIDALVFNSHNLKPNPFIVKNPSKITRM